MAIPTMAAQLCPPARPGCEPTGWRCGPVRPSVNAAWQTPTTDTMVRTTRSGLAMAQSGAVARRRGCRPRRSTAAMQNPTSVTDVDSARGQDTRIASRDAGVTGDGAEITCAGSAMDSLVGVVGDHVGLGIAHMPGGETSGPLRVAGRDGVGELHVRGMRPPVGPRVRGIRPVRSDCLRPLALVTGP